MTVTQEGDETPHEAVLRIPNSAVQ
jgi:hypothetical protein